MRCKHHQGQRYDKYLNTQRSTTKDWTIMGRKKGNTMTVHKREYLKIGRLSPAIAKSIGVTAGDIRIDSHAVTHMMKGHQKELQEMGCSPLLFAKMIIATFSLIYEGHDGKLLLVCEEDCDHQKTAVISLVLQDKRFWEVVTAGAWRTSFFKRKTPIYKKRHT